MITRLLLAFGLVFAASVHAADPVLAENAWATVRKSDLDAELTRFPVEQHFEFLSSAERIAKMVENILVNKTLAVQAREQGIDKDAAVQAEITSQAERVLARRRIEAFDKDLKLPDLEKRAREIYKLQPERFRDKAVYDTAHILVDTKCRAKDEAQARAEMVFAEVQSGKVTFADEAAKYSDDASSGKKGGILDPATLDRFAAEFAEAVKKIKPGEISPPVATPYGYHVVKLLGVKQGRQYTYDEVKGKILEELTQAYVKEQRTAFLDKIKGDASLKVNVEALDAIKTDINAAPGAKRPG
jgi:parvulin-like peptidyl-prolyl isomerase